MTTAKAVWTDMAETVEISWTTPQTRLYHHH
jgi:hypothetical protein